MRALVILLLLLIALNQTTEARPTFAIKTVVIDAGHGGKDPGAIGLSKTQEKDVALGVALSLGKKIKEQFPDVKVLYTRSTDVFIPLVERANFANKNKADLFISIHCNAASSRSAKGSSTYVLGLHKSQDNLEVAKRENAVIELEDNIEKNYDFNPNSPEGHIIMSMKQNAFLEQSIDIAALIESELTGRKDASNSRGVKQAGFFVLYQTSMPSLLAEIGFISNPTEEMYLASKEGQDEIATGLFNAFSTYKSHIEKTSAPKTTVAKDSSTAVVAQTNIPPKQVPPVEEGKKDVQKQETIKPVLVKEEPKQVAIKNEPPKTESPKPEVIKKEEVKTQPIVQKEPQKPAPAKEENIVKQTSATSLPDKKETSSTNGLVFKVQMLASAKPLKAYPQLTQTFGKIELETLTNGINRFMTGQFNSYEDAERLLPQAVKIGFPDAFVIAYKDGVRLDVAATRAYKKK